LNIILSYARFEVFTAVTMKNVVFWDKTKHFIPHRKYFTSPLRSPTGECYVRFEVFTAVTVKNVVLWDKTKHFIPHSKHITSPLRSPTG
jgi:hypothetical protein